MNAISRPAMAQPGQAVAPARPIDAVRAQLEKMSAEFEVALPQHIPVDRFKRVALTAINQNEDLLTADRKSLFGACMKAAQDGLLPDGREGALVIFNTRAGVGNERKFVKAVQWMPMVYGIIKKMRNSGELASIVAHEVYARDKFFYKLGDDESIEHEPYMGDEDAGKMIAVYAIAKLKDGTIQREVMTRKQVEKVRAASKSGSDKADPTKKANGPWVEWYEEMARKSVIRRLSKYLPMSTEIDDLLRREDALNAAADTVSRGLPSVAPITLEAQAEEEVAQIAHDQTPAVTVPAEPEREEVPAFDEETGEIYEPARSMSPTRAAAKPTTTAPAGDLF